MVTHKDVKQYIEKLYEGDNFLDLDSKNQEKIVFSANELLSDYYRDKLIDVRIVSLQVLHMLNKDTEYEQLKQKGVNSYSVKGVSISFSDSSLKAASYNSDSISPAVISIIGDPIKNGAKVSELL